MGFLKIAKKLKYDFDKLNLLSWFCQTIRGLGVSKVEDRFGIFWHDGGSDFFIEMVKIKFNLGEELMIFLIPG